MYYIIGYIILISFVSVIMTVTDKKAAEKGRRRISENALILTALLGGSAAMYYTMKTIRHKTLHKKFMIGLPLITVLHIIAGVTLYMYFLGIMPI